MNAISPCREGLSKLQELERLNEQLLVLQTQRKAPGAFDQLVALYDKRLLYYLRRLVGENDRAADVSQEVWLTVFKKIATLRSPAAFRVWLFQIAHNRAISTIQRELRRGEAHEEYFMEADPAEEWDELSLLENTHLVH